MSKSYFQVLCLIRYFAAWADNALDGSEEELPPPAERLSPVCSHGTRIPQSLCRAGYSEVRLRQSG